MVTPIVTFKETFNGIPQGEEPCKAGEVCQKQELTRMRKMRHLCWACSKSCRLPEWNARSLGVVTGQKFDLSRDGSPNSSNSNNNDNRNMFLCFVMVLVLVMIPKLIDEAATYPTSKLREFAVGRCTMQTQCRHSHNGHVIVVTKAIRGPSSDTDKHSVPKP